VLAATGFVLDQSALIDAASVAPLAGFRTFQVPVRDIAELAGVDLGPLIAADVLAPVPGARATEWRELVAPADIRL
jgi:endonuclease G